MEMIIVLDLKERPDLTEKYPAIDGIRKQDRNFRECDMGGVFYTPSEEPIRPDVAKILALSKIEFDNWFYPRFEATKTLLDQWKLFGSIPYLSYGGAAEYTMTANSTINYIVDSLEKGMDYLNKIKERWAEANVHQSN
jgi:hypothetical protein